MSKAKLLTYLAAMVIVMTQGICIFINARKRGTSHYWLWGLLGLTNFPSATIIYLIVMGTTREKCKFCGKEIKKGLKTCPYCGKTLRESCPNCGKEIEKDWEFCPECKIKLKEK